MKRTAAGLRVIGLSLAAAGLFACGNGHTASGQAPASTPAAVTSPPAASMSAAPPQDTSGSAISWSSTQTVPVEDPQYQMTAFTLDVPANWKSAGAIVHGGGCHGKSVSLKYTMQSPDGTAAIVVLPGVRWTWTDDPNVQRMMEQQHCAPIALTTAADFLVNIAVPNIRPNAKIVGVLPLLPEGQASIAKQLETERQQSAATARQYGQKPPELTIDGARVRVQYLRDNRSVEEMISAVIDCTATTLPPLPGQPAFKRRDCSSRSTVIERAPQSLLDRFVDSPQTKALPASVKPNPQWQARVQQDQQAAFRQMQDSNNHQFQAFTQHSRDVTNQMLANGRAFQQSLQRSTDSAMANDRAQQNAVDHAAHLQELDSLNQKDFVNPATGQTVQASSLYNHQWMSSDGSTLIQTDDHSFDPNRQVSENNQDWTELEPQQ